MASACLVAITVSACAARPAPRPVAGVPPATASRAHAAASAAASASAAVSDPVQCVARQAPWRLGSPVSREFAAPVGADILLAGGLDSGNNSLSAVVLLDPRTGHVTPAGQLALPVHDAGGAVLPSGTFVFGGGAAASTAEVQRLVSTGPSSGIANLPDARSDLAVATVRGRAYVIGGYDGATLTRQVLMTTDGASFAPAGALTVPVRYPAVAVVGDTIWVLGGQTASGVTTAIQRINTASGAITVAGHLPRGLAGASAFVLGGQIVLAGGSDASGSPTTSLLHLDPSTGRALACGRLPAAVQDAGSAAIGSVGYLLGGEQPTTTDSVMTVSLSADPGSGGAR